MELKVGDIYEAKEKDRRHILVLEIREMSDAYNVVVNILEQSSPEHFLDAIILPASMVKEDYKISTEHMLRRKLEKELEGRVI